MSPNDKVWGVNKKGSIYRYQGNNKWQKVSGKLNVVSVGPSGVWGVNKSGSIWYRKGTYGKDNTSGSKVS